MPRKVRKAPKETQEQITVIQRVRFLYPSLAKLVMAIPNGGDRDPRTAAQMVLEGLTKGAPDILVAVPFPTDHGLFVEMKRGDGSGKVSKDQEQMRDLLIGQGYRHAVVEGTEAAWELIERRLEYAQGKERIDPQR